jgi:adenylate kinase
MNGMHATREGPRVLVLGRPGSGKGTQCGPLAHRLGVPHISTGDLFRETVARDTPLGRMVSAYMDSGDLVPDDLVLDVVADRLGPRGAAIGFVLDGFPRTVLQAEQLEEMLEPYTLDLAIDLVVPPDVARRRLASRLVCGDCGRSIGPAAPPGPRADCRDCGGAAAERADDSSSTVAHRLAVYDEITAPLSGWLQERGLLVTVDGLGQLEEVARRIDEACDRVLGTGSPASHDLAS